jgi:hypothetical protein
VPEGVQERLGADRPAADAADRVHRVVVQVEQVGVVPVARHCPERARFRLGRVRPFPHRVLTHGSPPVEPMVHLFTISLLTAESAHNNEEDF